MDNNNSFPLNWKKKRRKKLQGLPMLTNPCCDKQPNTSGKHESCRPIDSRGQLVLSVQHILLVSKMVLYIGLSWGLCTCGISVYKVLRGDVIYSINKTGMWEYHSDSIHLCFDKIKWKQGGQECWWGLLHALLLFSMRFQLLIIIWVHAQSRRRT